MHCLQTIFPFNHIEDNQEFFSVIMECVSDYPFQFHEMNTKVFIPFEINESTNSLKWIQISNFTQAHIMP